MEPLRFAAVDGTGALTLPAVIEGEFAKDRWDARHIPGLRSARHTGEYHMNFAGIAEPFCPYVKDYARFLIAADRAVKTIATQVRYLKQFFFFFCQRYPTARSLQELREQDIDAFILSLQIYLHDHGGKRASEFVWRHIHTVEAFLAYLERTQSPIKPQESTARLIWPHHYPRHAWPWPRSQEVKYIPQIVLKQLDTHAQHIPTTYIPVVLLLRASGWRISDVLSLQLETCLEQDGDKFWLIGDIQKTHVLGHKIPITAEVAAVILAQRAWVKKHYTPSENPHHWLFPASKKRRNYQTQQRFLLGNPLKSDAVREALNRLAQRCQIHNEQGEIFHFKLHAFRHTKAVELLNNGMSLVLVQQWMAHASPEMTLIYARILDETMRKAWEKTVELGIVQFNDGKPQYVPGKHLRPLTGENTFDPERVREHRQNIKMALGSCLKTAKIMCKFVELPCFHCPAYVLTSDDLPALEVYEQHILERIEIGKQAGNAHWTLVNQKNLDERVRPAIALLGQGQIVAKTDKQEREYTDEEWEQRHHQENVDE
jgi:integrase